MLYRVIRKYTILICCLLCVHSAWAQRRFLTKESWEYRLAELADFSFENMDGHTDAFWGLHASQYVGSHNLLGFSVEGAWTSLISQRGSRASNFPGGGAIGLHLLYEYQYSGWLIQTGIGINYQQVYNIIRDTSFYHYGMHDNWEEIESAEYTLKHSFYNRRDMARNLYGQVPLYLGHYIIGPEGVGYFLAGLHLNYAFWGNTQQNLNGTTTARYGSYLGVWHEMDNHGYRKDVPIERKGDRLKLKFDLMVHAEIGYEYTTYHGPHNYRIVPGDRIDCRLRFAGFMDFGILNICPLTNNVLYETPMESIYDFPTYRMDHVFSTKDAQQFWLRNIYVGVRMTVLFALPRKEWCILCDPWKH